MARLYDPRFNAWDGRPRRNSIGQKRQANALTPLCRLPDEVLEQILIDVQGSHICMIPAARDEFPEPPDGVRWRRVMLVCFRLRLVALQSSVLWAFVDYRLPKKWLQLCAERSRTTLPVLLAEVKDSHSAELAIRFLARAHSAYIHFRYTPNYAVLQEMQKVMDASASALRCLRVTSDLLGGWKLHDRFLDGQLSRLAQLSLSDADVETFPELPNMQDLHLSGFAPQLCVTQMARFFAGMPRLHTLHITNARQETERVFRPPHPTDTMIHSPVAVPRLEHLTIRAGFYVTHCVLQALRLPTTLRSLDVEVWQADRMLSIAQDYATAIQVSQLFEYVQAFNASVCGYTNALPKRLVLSSSDSYTSQNFVGRVALELRPSDSWGGCRVYFAVEGALCLMNEDALIGIFSSVTLARVLLSTSLLDLPQLWSCLSTMSSLERIELCGPRLQSEVAEAQRWADMRREGGFPVAQMTLEDYVTSCVVEWDPREGPLRNATWGAAGGAK